MKIGVYDILNDQLHGMSAYEMSRKKTRFDKLKNEKLKNEIFLSISRTKSLFKKPILWRWYALILFEEDQAGGLC